MTADGEIYVTKSPVHHNVIMGNQPAAAAGHLYSGTIDGRDVLIVYDRSGHYLPQLKHTKQFLAELQRRGIDLKDVYILLDSQPDKGPVPAVDI
jgi:hypothetical protein